MMDDHRRQSIHVYDSDGHAHCTHDEEGRGTGRPEIMQGVGVLCGLYIDISLRSGVQFIAGVRHFMPRRLPVTTPAPSSD